MAALTARRVGALALAASVLAPAVAAGGPAFLVEFGPEETRQERAQVLSLLGMELGAETTELSTQGGAVPRPVLVIRALHATSASGANEWKVTVVAQEPARTVEQRIVVGDVPPEAQPRELALAIAELVRSVQRPLPVAPPAAPKPAIAAVAPRTPEVKPDSPAIAAGAGARFFPALATVVADPRVAASFSPTRSVLLGVDVGALVGFANDSLGQIHLTAPTVGLSAGLSLPFSFVTLQVGPRLELGWAFVSGSPSSPGVSAAASSGLVLDLSAAGLARFAVRDRLWLALGLEAGYGIVGIDAHAQGRRLIGLGGPMLGLFLRLGIDI